MKSLKKFGLAAVVFLMAIGAAFASAYRPVNKNATFPSGLGHTNLSQIANQGQPCVARKFCEGGENVCQIQIGAPFYNLYEQSPTNVCNVTLLGQQ